MNEVSDDNVKKYGRYFAIQSNNASWSLSEKTMSEAEKRELLTTSFASLYHWQKVGTVRNIQLAHMMLARACSISGINNLALFYAQQCFDFFKQDDESWVVAFAYAILSHAYYAVGQSDLHKQTHQYALKLSLDLSKEDKEVFDATFSTIPSPE